MSITPHSIVRAVLDEQPDAMAVFLRNRMHCPGCAMSPFMTVAEAAANYRLDAEALAAELRSATGDHRMEGAR